MERQVSTQVGPYRDVLKASSVRGMLQRKARLADVVQPASGHEPEAARPARSRGAHDGRRLPMAPRRSARLCGFPAINDRPEGDPFPS